MGNIEPSYTELSCASSRVIANSSTAAAYGITGDGFSEASLAAYGQATCGRSQWAKITFFGTGSDNNTFTCRIYGRFPTADATPTISKACQLKLLGTATVTLSSAVGTANGAIGTAERIADTVGWVESAFMTASATAAGENVGAVHSPADNTPGDLMLAHLARVTDLIFDFNTGGSATACNAMCLVGRV